MRNETWVVLNPTVKYGIGDATDIEVSEALAVFSRTSGGHFSASESGLGDAFLKLKRRISLTEAIDIALMPVVKIPVAKQGLGNGAVELGLLTPVVVRLNDLWSLNFSPEIDRLRNSSQTGFHSYTAQLVNITRTLPHDLSVSFEWWGAWDRDPSGSTRQASLDVGLAWLLRQDLQLDLGINRGATRATPSFQGYVGIAKKY